MPVQAPVTCVEFERLAATSGPCELIDGEVRPLSPGGFRHGRASLRIAFLLDQFVSPRGLGRVVGNEVGLNLAQDPPRCRGADIAYLSNARLPVGKEPDGFLTVPPELVVEVLGIRDSWQEMLEKVQDYHRFGVDMVWVADPYTRTVKTFPRGGQPEILHEGLEIDGGAYLPGFRASIARFFED